MKTILWCLLLLFSVNVVGREEMMTKIIEAKKSSSVLTITYEINNNTKNDRWLFDSCDGKDYFLRLSEGSLIIMVRSLDVPPNIDLFVPVKTTYVLLKKGESKKIKIDIPMMTKESCYGCKKEINLSMIKKLRIETGYVELNEKTKKCSRQIQEKLTLDHFCARENESIFTVHHEI